MGDKTLLTAFNESDYAVRVDSSEYGTETQKLFDFLNANVIGQKRAAEHLARGRAIYNAGLQDDKGCAGSFLFAGPTGVGKTLMAEQFARYLIPGTLKPPITRIACGKFKESHRISELLGAPSGYVGYDSVPLLAQTKIDEPHFMAQLRSILKAGVEGKKLPKTLTPRQLADLYLMHKPHPAVVVFDEIEKAHSDIWDALLHIIDEGELAMGNGEITDFSNTVIILTCNIGGRRAQELLSGKSKSIGFSSVVEGENANYEAVDQQIYEETVRLTEQIFAPELVGRLRNEIIVFRSLQREHCALILDGMIDQLQNKFSGKSARSISLPRIHYADDVKEFLLDKGIDRKYGIRPLKKTLQKQVVRRLANAIENEGLRGGDEVLIKMRARVDSHGVIERDKEGKEIWEPEIFRKPRPEPPIPRRPIPVLPLSPGSGGNRKS